MTHTLFIFFISIRSFIGHFHPVLVHLPIGMLLLAVVLQGLSRKGKEMQFYQAATVAFLLGSISAVLSCISGWLLSLSDDYDATMINWHLWFGIAVAVISILLYLLHRNGKWLRAQFPLGVLLCLLIVITGHLGGSITHGSGYLTQSLFSQSVQHFSPRLVIDNVQEALVYQEVIQPLLQEKCYSCHNASKSKGGLQLHEPELLLKGGKHGKIIREGNPEASELIKRILLPVSHEDHMPPKEKPQPSEQDIALLQWWIAAGAPFDKKVKELPQPENIKPVLLALQQEAGSETSEPVIPATPVEKASESALQELRNAGVLVMPVAQNSNYLMANFVSAPSFSDKQAHLLLPLKKQLIWLKLGNTHIGDSALRVIAQCEQLMRLHLEQTKITDAGLIYLQQLKALRYLNLAGTAVTEAGVLQLKELPQLQSVYLYQTRVNRSQWKALQQQFPNTYLDSGGYRLPVLVSDTSVVRYQPGK